MKYLLNLIMTLVICSFCNFSLTSSAQAQTSLQLEADSDLNNPHLSLIETTFDFARLSFENSLNTKYWHIAGSANNSSTSKLNFFYSPAGDLFSIAGDDKTIGIGTTSPKYALDIKQLLDSPGSGPGPWGGLNLNGTGDNDWTLFAFSNLFDFYYKNTLKGRISGVDGNYTPMSDLRLKEDIEAIDDQQISNICKLRPVAYYMKDDPVRSGKATGFIAQDVIQIYPNLVVSGENSDSYLSLNYTAMIPYLVKGMQELAEQNDLLGQEISKLKQSLKSSKKE